MNYRRYTGLALAFACVLSASTTLAQAPTVTALTPTSGPAAGGQTVDITGTNFTGGGGIYNGTVMFGGVPATGVTLLSFTDLTAVSPPGMGTVDVTVNDNTNGPSSAAGTGNDYIYMASPTPVPTITEWAMILLATLVAAVAVKTIMDRRREACRVVLP